MIGGERFIYFYFFYFGELFVSLTGNGWNDGDDDDGSTFQFQV